MLVRSIWARRNSRGVTIAKRKINMIRKTYNIWGKVPSDTRNYLTATILLMVAILFLALGTIYDTLGVGVWFTVVAAIVLFVAPLSQI